MAQRVTQTGALVAYVPSQTHQIVTQSGVLVAYVESTSSTVTDSLTADAVIAALQSGASLQTRSSLLRSLGR